MALITFEDLPSTNTPINASNLNNNFGEINNPDKTIIANDFECKNLFNKKEWINGYIDTSTGDFVSYNPTATFGFIEVEVGKIYCMSINSSIGFAIYLYDSNKQLTGDKQVAYSGTSGVLTIPNNVVYIRVILNPDDTNPITQTIIDNLQPQLELGSSATSYTPYKKLIKDVGGYVKEDTTFYANDFKCRNLFNKSTANLDKFVNASDGTLSSYTGVFATDYIEVEPNTTYYWNDTTLRPNAGAFYNSSKTYISGIASPSTHDFTTPSNAKYVRLTGSTDNIGSYQLEIGSDATPYTPYKLIGEEVYSTGEIRIGTWINGKPLYRKVIDLGTFPNNAEKTVAHNIANIDVITKIYTFGRLSNGLTISLGYYDVTTPANSITIMCNKTNVAITTKNDRSAYTGYTILEYTKTTD